MKNLLLVLPVLFLFGLTSCSDVMDNSFSTNPVLGKEGRDNIVSSSSFPYPYLFNFNKVDGIQYSPLMIDDNSVEIYLPPINQKYLQFYVIVNYKNDKPTSLFFIDRISTGSFIIAGLNVSEVRELSVYGFDSINNTISPFPDNTLMNEIPNVWKANKGNSEVEYFGVRPFNLKYVFAEIESKEGSQLIFLQKPVSQSFTIPGYGEGTVGLKLFGYHTLYDVAGLMK